VRSVVANWARVAEDVDREVRLEAAALLFESAADELELAGAHARRAAEHFREGEVPRAAAHAWAAFGHLRTGEARLVAQAQEHRQRSLL
jgi:hypothetical protein